MSDQAPFLTNRQGHPVRDNQNTITVGPKGPATLENYNFIEKLAHFDRERVPERVVHARGASAHGFFEAYGTIGDEPASTYTRAKLLQTKGKQTPVFVRFSTVIHSKDSPETLRDPRGFAVKFYTEDGNWDLVGNNLRVFFIRDAIKFPDFIHSFKPDPVNNWQDPNRQFDFISQTPESIHMITLLFSPRGIPANYREQEGAGVNTYKLVNDEGAAVLVKFHWIPKQGVRSLTTPEAAEIQKEEFSHATKDLYEAIDRGDFPEWEFCVQIMADGEHPELDFDPLDDTKQWPESQFPLRKVGRMVLNKKPDNFFAESEQAAFGTGVKVDGIEFSADKMLQGRTFSYSDTQRYRVGPNYQQLPINAAKNAVHTNQRDGIMTRMQDEGGANPHVNYEPSILGGVREAPDDVTEYRPLVQGEVGRYVEDRTGDDYKQAGEIYRAFDDRHRDDLIDNLVTNLKKADMRVQERMVWHFLHADEDYGKRVAQGLGIDVEKARRLSPLPNKPAPGTNRNATDNVPGVTASGNPYASSARSNGNGSANDKAQNGSANEKAKNGSANEKAKNGNVAVLQRVFTLAEATGAR